MSAADNRRLIVMADWQLSKTPIYNLVWCRILQEYKIFGSRREFLKALDSLHDFTVDIFWPDGSVFTVPDLIKLFPDDDHRWLSDYLETDSSGLSPLRKVYRKDRVRIHYLYCQVADLKDA
ncbi:MAG: hypothetical protein R2748_35685 [Bryobacterales bacterium]